MSDFNTNGMTLSQTVTNKRQVLSITIRNTCVTHVFQKDALNEKACTLKTSIALQMQVVLGCKTLTRPVEFDHGRALSATLFA